jgi:phosphoglycolate phosphatase-like HAD superfamily hydrolase
VGDDPALDVLGARNAGLRVIQVVPGERLPTRHEPDSVIEGLGTLPEALALLGKDG